MMSNMMSNMITMSKEVNVCVGVLIHMDGMIKLEILLVIHGTMELKLPVNGQILNG